MIELPFDCINVHTLSCHRHPGGSEDSEQDNFPFKSMPALPPGLLGPRGHLLGEVGPASPAQTFIFPGHEASARRCTEPIIQADSLEGPGRGVAWAQEGVALHGQPLGPEDKMLCLILPMALKDGVIIFLSWQAWEGELRKVKWAGQGRTVSVCQKWGSRSGVFNRLFWGYLRGPWPPVSL